MRFLSSLFALALLLVSAASVWCSSDSWPTPAYTFPGLLSASSPALTSFNGRLYIAINGAYNGVGISSSSDGGLSWTAQNWILGSIVSNNQPSLAVFNNKLYLGVYVTGSHGFCLASSYDGNSWTGCNTVGSGDVYKGAVSLATYSGQLYYTVAGYYSAFCISSSSDGSSFSACRWVEGQLSVASPALVANGNSSLQLAWSASNQAFVASSTDGGITWSSPKNLLAPAATNTKPALVYLNGVQYAAFVGLDLGVYLSYSTDSGFSAFQQLAASGSSAGGQAPAIAVVAKNNLAVAWEGQGQPIYVRTSN